MTAYGNQNKALAGQKVGLRHEVGSFAAVETIPFGSPIFGYIGEGVQVGLLKTDVQKVVFDADFVASNSIAFTVNGEAITPVVFATDHDTTAAALAAAVGGLPISAANPAGVECVLDATDTDNRTFLVRTKTVAAVATSTVTGGAGQAAATITGSNGQVFRGIALMQQQVTGEYTEYDSVSGMTQRQCWVPAASASALAPVYVTAAGVLTDVASGNIALTGAQWISNLDNGLAIIEVYNPVTLADGSNF